MKGLDIEAFSEKMLETLYSFRNKSIPNASIGGEIQIRASSIRKYKSFFADEKKRLIVPYIPELLGKAEFMREDTYTPETEKNIKSYWKADVPVRIDNKDFDVRLTVKQDDKGNLFWDAQVKERARRTVSATNRSVGGLGVDASTLNVEIIPKAGEKVNQGIDAQSAELLMRKFITFKAKGMKASSALMESLLSDLEDAITEGREAKEESGFEKRKTLAIQKNAVRQAIVARAQKAGVDKKSLTTKFGNFYREFANIYSMLNSIGGKMLADTYGKEAELKSNGVSTAVYKQFRNFKNKTKEIFGFKRDGDIFNMMADMSKQKYQLVYRQETLEGQTLEIDGMQLVDIYNAIKNDKTRADYAESFGSYTLPDGSVRLDVEDLIDGNLTAAQKEWADMMMEQADSYYDRLNEMYIKMYGIDLPKTENYWPATSEHFQETDFFSGMSAQEGSASFIKERVKKRVIPRPSDAYAKFSKHIEGAENFVQMGEFYKNLRDIFNSLRVSSAIKETYGNSVYSNLSDLIKGLWFFNQSGTMSGYEKKFNAALNNWVAAKIALNPRIYFTQLTSFTNYMENMPVFDFVSGFVEGMTHPVRTARFMEKAAPFLEARYAGGFNEALKRLLSEGGDEGVSGVFSPKTKYNARNFLSVLVRLGDKQAIVYGGYAYVKYLTEKKGLSLEDAAKEFEFATLRSQQSGTGGSLSSFQMSRNPFVKLVTAFKNTPLQYLRKMVDAWMMYKNGDITAGQFAKTEVNYIVIQSVLFVFSKYLFDQAAEALTGGVPDDDEDEKLFWDVINQMAFGGFDGIPFAGDAGRFLAESAEGQKKYFQSILTMPMLDDLERALRKAFKDEKDVWDFADIAVPFLEVMTGSPVGTAVRYAKKAVKEEK